MTGSYELGKENKWGVPEDIDKANKCIKCNVDNCKYHCKDDNYCSRARIVVDSNKDEPRHCESVDCKSFVQDKPKSSKSSLFGAIDSVKDSFTDTFLS